MDAKTLDQYLTKYGALLGDNADAVLDPLHVPGRDPQLDFTGYLRKPFNGQANLIAGVVKELRRQKGAIVTAAVGTGKTLMATLVADVLRKAGGNPSYRVLCMVPTQLLHKWKREILETLPGSKVTILDSCFTLNRLYKKRKLRFGPRGAEWYVIGRDRSKLGAEWRGAVVDDTYLKFKRPGYRCPKCGAVQLDKEDNVLSKEYFSDSQRACKAKVWKLRWQDTPAGRVRKLTEVECGEKLWQHFGPYRPPLGDGAVRPTQPPPPCRRPRDGIFRFEPARYVQRRLKNFFDFFVLDEAHEEKSATSAQGEASGCLVAACKRSLFLTGTLIGGQADHVRAIMLRLCPKTLIDEGLNWHNPGAFNKRYGRIERTTTEKSSEGVTARHSRGKGRSVNEHVRPGVSPELFGRHLLGVAAYLDLDQLSDSLPKCNEFTHPVEMDREQAREYDRLDRVLREANGQLLVNGNRALLGALIHTLMEWVDYPFDWKPVGYWEGKKARGKDPNAGRKFVPIVQPITLGTKIRPKEQKLLDILHAEVNAGRQCWVYVQNTNVHDVQKRIVSVLKRAGFDAIGLRSSVPPEKREQWIKDTGGKFEVVVSHPDLVKTGLDLFDKRGGHNFPSLIGYETGYNLFTLRQAMGRAWRIGQRKECRNHYLYYAGTVQDAAMILMGQKMAASLNIEGKFSTEGLIALGGEDVDMEMALAKALDKMLPGDAAKAWQGISKIGADMGDPAGAFGASADDDLDAADDMLAELDELNDLLGGDDDDLEAGELDAAFAELEGDDDDD